MAWSSSAVLPSPAAASRTTTPPALSARRPIESPRAVSSAARSIRPPGSDAAGSASGRRDVLVEAEDVAGVIFILERDEAVVLGAVGGADAVRALGREEVHV